MAKPGSEALHTVRVLHRLICESLEESGLPAGAVGLFEGRKDVQRVLGADNAKPMVDLVIPRGGPKMIQLVRNTANEAGTGVPVMGHGSGVCHVYVDEFADPDKALRIGMIGINVTMFIVNIHNIKLKKIFKITFFTFSFINNFIIIF